VHIVTLRDPASSVAAEFVPDAGMIGTSLTDSGTQLLGQRRGLDAYVTAGKTMGIPILYPWANRLGADTYTAEESTVTLIPGENGVRPDPNGLPIHGVLAAYAGWRVTAESVNELTAELDFGAQPSLLASFPYPHVLALTVRLLERTLTVRTTVTPSGDTAVPLCFGFHPYLTLAGAARERWEVELPVREQLVLDECMIPTGAREPVDYAPVALDGRSWDDAFAGLASPPRFVASTDRRTVALELGEGYEYSQVFSPPDAEFICFEPMTAPTNALSSGDGLRMVAPGESYRAAFSVTAS